jgi:hypothetical protein
MKKFVVFFIGASFRTGGQWSIIRGQPDSYNEQKEACNSHIDFLNFVKEKYQYEADIVVGTYDTPYTNELKEWYSTYTDAGIFNFYDDLVGLTSLFHRSFSSIEEKLEEYDFILYIRIDLILKEYFKRVFNPFDNQIKFTGVCFSRYHAEYGSPRIVDMIMFYPKKYYDKHILSIIPIGHETWWWIKNRSNNDLIEMDLYTKTLHDSDSFKDWNPLYKIANRPENTVWKDAGLSFDKDTLQIEQGPFLTKECFV